MSEYTDNNISPLIGSKAFFQTFIMDDATSSTGSGGVQTAILGSFGQGKSTLMAWMAEYSRYMRVGSKESYISRLVHHGNILKYETSPTTVLWRCRDLDLWPVLIPANWNERIPDMPAKELALFVNENDIDDICFFCYDRDHKPIPVPNLPAIQTYTTADDLIGKIHEGSINIVLEPQKYRLSPRLCGLLAEARNEFDAGVKPDERKDDLVDIPKRGRGRPLKIKEPKDYSQHAIKSGCFWFDVTAATMAIFGNKPIMMIWDEADDFLSAASSDAHWWLININSELQRDFRKANISTVVSSHGFALLHDSAYKRATHRILLPGVKASKNTMVRYTQIISRLPKGHFIIEIQNKEFGVCKFGRIPYVIQSKIDGMKNSFRALDGDQKARIYAEYEKQWNGEQATVSKLPTVIEV
ncbi:hypothetical protein [Methanoregula sp.]|jgi:hypothetical protein|uniref:hypothetical protein n=1 Tax=Methanoregula sp. TaxID=2052170 RepID=UPI0025E74CB6|nr:hypothetical protein [Methanoregula sp.]